MVAGALNSLLALLANIMDEPTLQEPAATLIAAALKTYLPDVAEKAIGDFVAMIGKKLSTPAGA